jgi:hypothetical protein
VLWNQRSPVEGSLESLSRFLSCRRTLMPSSLIVGSPLIVGTCSSAVRCYRETHLHCKIHFYCNYRASSDCFSAADDHMRSTAFPCLFQQAYDWVEAKDKHIVYNGSNPLPNWAEAVKEALQDASDRQALSPFRAAKLGSSSVAGWIKAISASQLELCLWSLRNQRSKWT